MDHYHWIMRKMEGMTVIWGDGTVNMERKCIETPYIDPSRAYKYILAHNTRTTYWQHQDLDNTFVSL